MYDGSGLCIDGHVATSLLLEDARLSTSSFMAIIGETTSITDVSLDGLTFTNANPESLASLLGIGTLDNVTVDPNLYALYQDEFDAFAAMEGNSLTVTAANLDCNEDGTISILDANCSAQLDNLLQTSTRFLATLME